MKDSELIEIMAKLWISSGGDSEGFNWLWLRIKEKIRELEQEEREELIRAGR